MRCKEKRMFYRCPEKRYSIRTPGIQFPVQSPGTRFRQPGLVLRGARLRATRPYNASMDRGNLRRLPILWTIFPRQTAPRRIAQCGILRCGRGQALFEYILAFPTFALLLLFVGAFAWYWWTQSLAAVAIHDGVRTTAAYEGTKTKGMAVVEERLFMLPEANGAALTNDPYKIFTDTESRSVYGYIDIPKSVRIPFMGHQTLFRVRAYSFQRDWAFYAKPVNGWE